MTKDEAKGLKPGDYVVANCGLSMFTKGCCYRALANWARELFESGGFWGRTCARQSIKIKKLETKIDELERGQWNAYQEAGRLNDENIELRKFISDMVAESPECPEDYNCDCFRCRVLKGEAEGVYPGNKCVKASCDGTQFQRGPYIGCTKCGHIERNY